MYNQLHRAVGIQVKRVTHPDDIRRCHELFLEYGEWVTQCLRDKYKIALDASPLHERFLKDEVPQLLGPRGGLYMATQGGVIAGVGALRPAGDSVAEVRRMYVRPESRSFGLGRALLSRIVADAHALGYGRVRLQTLAFMHEARRLYETTGFRYVGRFPGEATTVGIDEVTLFMEINWNRGGIE